MNLLGLSICHDAHAVVVRDGDIVSAVGEERLNRVKMYWGFPFLAVEETLNLAGLRGDEIDAVCVGSTATRELPGWLLDLFLDRSFTSFDGSNHYSPEVRWKYLVDTLRRRAHLQTVDPGAADRRIRGALLELGIQAPIHYFDHHHCHCASSYYTAGMTDCLSVSIDGGGDGLYAAAYLYENGKETRLTRSPAEGCAPEYSPADVYSYVTKYLGFKRIRHEGKITGLAAYGDPSRLYPHFERLSYLDDRDLAFRSSIPYDDSSLKFLRCMLSGKPYDTGMLRYFERAFGKERREDVAAAVQKRCEDLAGQWVGRLRDRHPSPNILLSGGLFSNVRINQVVSEIPGVEQVYIHPCMGDGGLAAGACLIHYADYLRAWGQIFTGKSLPHVYLGPSYTDSEAEAAFLTSGLRFRKSDHPEAEIAALLSRNKVVGHFHGRMEYGPRALGNRSILYPTNDPTVNDWMNKRLRRNEFMPFAPVCLREHAEDLFQDFKKGRVAAQYMTITFSVRERWRRLLAGVCHVDHTARPQTVTREANPRIHGILEEYYKLTGIPALINTSFNMHEEPIVCSPSDAIRSFRSGACDVLVLGPYLSETGGP